MLRFGSKCSGRFQAGLLIALVLASHAPCFAQGSTDNTPDWFYPEWAATARFNTPVRVLDTDSALGRYSLQRKELGLKDLSRVHGHMCDGLVISFVEIKAALERLFPDGIVDRTDLRAVSKNGSCWVDAVAMITGARINFQTLRIDNAIGDGFIIQRISTGEAYEVRLKPGVFPAEQARLEARIRESRKLGRPVSAADIDRVEVLANDLSRRLLNSPPAEILEVKKLDRYEFRSNDDMGERGDVINKSSPRH
jgi:formylmethanofuran dehydrogenase subunit E